MIPINPSTTLLLPWTRLSLLCVATTSPGSLGGRETDDDGYIYCCQLPDHNIIVVIPSDTRKIHPSKWYGIHLPALLNDYVQKSFGHGLRHTSYTPLTAQPRLIQYDDTIEKLNEHTEVGTCAIVCINIIQYILQQHYAMLAHGTLKLFDDMLQAYTARTQIAINEQAQTKRKRRRHN